MSELQGLQPGLEALRQAGAELVAISSSGWEDHAALASRLGISFPLLSDPEGSVIKAYGLEHPGALPLVDLPVARPAELILDRERTVRRRLLTENWRVRASPETLLEALRSS